MTLAATLLFVAASAHGRAQPDGLLAHERYSLANGLDVILHVDRKLPLVAANLSYHVGSGHDAAHPGLAHLTEHLMFRGTRNIDDGDYDDLLDDAGAQHNATTRLERTSYYAVLPSNQLPLMLWLESDRMAKMLPALDQTKVDEEKQTTSDEWRYRVSSTRTGGSWFEVAEAIVPAGHPWERASPDKIARLTIADVREFVKLYHGPANATLVLAGDLPEDVRDEVQRVFGKRKGGQPPPPADFSLPEQSAERRLELRSAFASNPILIVHWPSPAMFTAGDAEADIFVHVFEDRFDAQAKTLAPGKVLFADAMQESHVGLSELTLVFEGTSRTSPAQLLEIVEATLADMREHPCSEQELTHVRRELELRTLTSLQDLAARADRIQLYVSAGKPPDWLAADLARYEQVTAKSIAKLMDTALTPARRSVVFLQPTEPG